MYQQQKTTSYDQFERHPSQLNEVVDPMNKLRRLARLINWGLLSTSYSRSFQSSQSPSPRLIFGLLYLQAKEDISSEELLERWLVTPEWQYFCGETTLNDSYPMHPAVLSIWRREIGVSGSKLMCAALSPSFAEISIH